MHTNASQEIYVQSRQCHVLSDVQFPHCCCSPQAPTHFLVIPKNRNGLTRLSKMTEEHKALVGHLMYVAQLVAKQGECQSGQTVIG